MNKNIFDIGCITCSLRLAAGSLNAGQAALKRIMITGKSSIFFYN